MNKVVKITSMRRWSKNEAGDDYFGNLGNFARSRAGRGDISGQTVTGRSWAVWSILMCWSSLVCACVKHTYVPQALLCHPTAHPLVWEHIEPHVSFLTLPNCLNQPFSPSLCVSQTHACLKTNYPVMNFVILSWQNWSTDASLAFKTRRTQTTCLCERSPFLKSGPCIWGLPP